MKSDNEECPKGVCDCGGCFDPTPIKFTGEDLKKIRERMDREYKTELHFPKNNTKFAEEYVKKLMDKYRNQKTLIDDVDHIVQNVIANFDLNKKTED